MNDDEFHPILWIPAVLLLGLFLFCGIGTIFFNTSSNVADNYSDFSTKCNETFGENNWTKLSIQYISFVDGAKPIIYYKKLDEGYSCFRNR